MKVVFCTKEFWPGVKNFLDSIKSVLVEEFKEKIEIQSFFIPQNGFNGSLIHVLKSTPPDLLIIGGWDNSIRNVIANVNKSRTKVFLVWCSPVSQTDLGNENLLFVDAYNFMKLGLVQYTSFIFEKDYQTLKSLNENYVYTPVCFDEKELELNKVKEKEIVDGFSCDLFCAANPRKNLFSQILCLSRFENIKVHTNFTRPEYSELGKRFLKNQVNYGWISRQEYLKLIQQMDFGMQVSFADGFNLVAAEHMFYRIPMICSSFFPYYNGNKDLLPLAVQDRTDCNEIYDKIKSLILSRSRMEDLGEISRQCILKKNDENKIVLKELFNKILVGV